MAEALLSFGVEKLWNLLVRESEQFQGVEEQVNGLISDLSMLGCFLEDADAKKHTSAMVNNTIKEIREIVFDAEDIVETFLLKEEIGKTSGIRKRVKRLARVVVDRRELASDIRAISKRISKVIRDMQSLGVQQAIVNEGYTKSLQERQRRMRQTFSNDNESVLVGWEENVNKLVGYIVHEGSSSQVVSITGMGGIGKTTLARQVFNHETVKSHFGGLAWVCVTQQFTREYVWRAILRQLMPECKVSEMADEELQEKIRRVLETQKALIVLDDIWREEDWEMIKPMFPRVKGWKILLTSRNEGVALRADPKCFTFKPDCLNPEESWTLFQRIAFPNTTENKVDEKMEAMGKQMIKDCGGLPLAVKVLGGVLAAQHTLSEWTRIHENIKPHIIGNDRNTSSVYHILYMSFEELPVYLKHCFLYLAHFPEDYTISVEDLSYYLAAERIQRPMYYDGESIRDVGDGYIDELVKRNMVISERDVHTSRFETCQLHDMMREVCLLKAEEKNFLQIVQGASTATSKSPCKSRRLVLHQLDETINVEREVKNPKLRSLLLFGHSRWKASVLCFTRLQLMRVLDLSNAKFKRGKLPSSIGKLIHLRYLSLSSANVTWIPSSMRNLKQLIYLNLDNFLGELYMPNFLTEMRELTYLYLPRHLHDKVKIELGNLVNLETLENFSTKNGSVRDLQAMTRLRALSIYMEDNGKGISMETLSSSLSQLRCLENLTIIDQTQRYERCTEEFVLDCINLKQLKLIIYMPRLPNELQFPSRLTSLSLEGCRLEEDPMPILEKLGHLKEANFEGNAFCGRGMVCSKGGFPQLQKLIFYGLKEWEEWIVEEGSMPLLHTLIIWDCQKLEEWIVEESSMPLLHTLHITDYGKLKEFPNALRFIPSLKDLTVELRGEQWKDRLSAQHLPSRLTSLRLRECRLEEDPMPILEKLGHLKELIIWNDSFNGKRMVCSRGGFPQLQTLEFNGLKEWEEWVVEEGSMPLLHTLEFISCGNFPDALRFIPSLKDLRIYLWGEEWKERLSAQGLPSRLTRLHLRKCSLEEDPMPILENLDHLKELNIRMDSLCVRRMVSSRGGFPQLQNLELGGKELEEWIVEEGSMPLLQSLTICDCQKLKELPDGLRFITSLKYLNFHCMREEWKDRLLEGGEDYHKVQHIPFVKFYEE